MLNEKILVRIELFDLFVRRSVIGRAAERKSEVFGFNSIFWEILKFVLVLRVMHSVAPQWSIHTAASIVEVHPRSIPKEQVWFFL